MFLNVRMPAGEGVAAGQTATFKLPVGRQFHEIELTYAGLTLAQMTAIRVFANGKVIHRYAAADRDAMNQFDGRAAAAGILVLPFSRYNMKTRAAESETALITGLDGGITSLYVEIDIDAAAAAPVLSMTATQTNNPPNVEKGAGTVMHILSHTRDPSGAGEFELSDLPRMNPTAQLLNRVFFKPSANAISKMVVERDSFVLFERLTALNDLQHSDGVRVPVAGWEIIDTTERGYSSALSLAGDDFRYRLTVTGAMALTIYTETLGILGD